MKSHRLTEYKNFRFAGALVGTGQKNNTYDKQGQEGILHIYQFRDWYFYRLISIVFYMWR
jgi:hypothetical protein